jgi:hypothetical protein
MQHEIKIMCRALFSVGTEKGARSRGKQKVKTGHKNPKLTQFRLII